MLSCAFIKALVSPEFLVSWGSRNTRSVGVYVESKFAIAILITVALFWKRFCYYFLYLPLSSILAK